MVKVLIGWLIKEQSSYNCKLLSVNGRAKPRQATRQATLNYIGILSLSQVFSIFIFATLLTFCILEVASSQTFDFHAVWVDLLSLCVVAFCALTLTDASTWIARGRNIWTKRLIWKKSLLKRRTPSVIMILEMVLDKLTNDFEVVNVIMWELARGVIRSLAISRCHLSNWPTSWLRMWRRFTEVVANTLSRVFWRLLSIFSFSSSLAALENGWQSSSKCSKN